MRSVLDDVRAEERAEARALTPAARVALALRLGARDLATFRAAQRPAVNADEAARRLERRRQAGRRRSRCLEELIG